MVKIKMGEKLATSFLNILWIKEVLASPCRKGKKSAKKEQKQNDNLILKRKKVVILRASYFRKF